MAKKREDGVAPLIRPNIFLTNQTSLNNIYYRPPEGGWLYDMKVVSGYAFLRAYYV